MRVCACVYARVHVRWWCANETVQLDDGVALVDEDGEVADSEAGLDLDALAIALPTTRGADGVSNTGHGAMPTQAAPRTANQLAAVERFRAECLAGAARTADEARARQDGGTARCGRGG